MKHEINSQNQNEFLLKELQKIQGKSSILNELTERERSCLLLAASGKTSNETANLLGIKASTVETYRKNIKEKLACNTIAQAVFEGLRCGYFKTIEQRG